MAVIICLPLFKHAAPCALCFARESAGISIAARMPIMAMTTSSSIKVNARQEFMLNQTTIKNVSLQVLWQSDRLFSFVGAYQFSSLPTMHRIVPESHIVRVVAFIPFHVAVIEKDVLALGVRLPVHPRRTVCGTADAIL